MSDAEDEIRTETGDAERRTDGRFAPGKSGNPKGRPPLPSNYHEAMNGRLGPRALEVLEEILEDVDHPRREQAAEYITNRWKGAPTSRSELSGLGGGPIETRDLQMTREEMRREIERLEAGKGDPGDVPPDET